MRITSLPNPASCLLIPDYCLLDFFFGTEFSGIVLEHNGYAVLDRIGEAVGFADQFLFRLVVDKRPLADRAYQNVKQFRIHSLSQFAQNQLPQRGVGFDIDR